MSVPLILIGGVNRSGTSLMRRIVGSHSQVAIPPTDFEFFEVAKGLPLGTPAERRAVAERLLAHPKLRAWGLPTAEILSGAEDIGPSARDLFTLLIERFRQLSDAPRSAWKTPKLEFHLDAFDAWFGESYRFVHLVRHPLDVYASNRWYDGQEQRLYTEGWANEWVRSISIAIRRQLTQPRQCRLVRYEDLTASPRDVVRGLCEFLDLPPELDRMLAMSEYAEKDNSSFSVVGSRTYAGHIRQSDTVGRRGMLAAKEVAAIVRICAYSAQQLGYDLGPGSPPDPGQRACEALDELPARHALVSLARYVARRGGAAVARTLGRSSRRLGPR